MKRGVQRYEESKPLRWPSYRQDLIVSQIRLRFPNEAGCSSQVQSCWHEKAVTLPADHGQTVSVRSSGLGQADSDGTSYIGESHLGDSYRSNRKEVKSPWCFY